jgi:hypothetical protein
VRVAAVIAIVLAARVAYADDELARARQLEAQLEYDQALAIVEGLLARGGADPARYVELRMFAGKLAGGLDRARVAEDHFARAIAVRPDVDLPDGTSPKLTEPFARAKSRKLPLIVRATNKHGLVALDVTDALGIVAGIAVHTVVGGKHADLVERTALRLVVAGDAIVVEVAALDASGNRLWIGAPVVESTPAPPFVASRERRFYARWTTWAGATAVALAAGAFAAWRFDSAQNEWDALRARGEDFSELERVEDRGKRWGLAANISAGVALAAGVTAIVVGVRGRSVTIAPGPATGVGVAGRF